MANFDLLGVYVNDVAEPSAGWPIAPLGVAGGRLSDGTLIVPWQDNTDGDLVFSYSTDGGKNWTKCAYSKALVSADKITCHVAFDDTIWVTYNDSTTAYAQLMAFTWTGTNVSELWGPTKFVTDAIAPVNGVNVVVMTDPADSGQYRVFVACYYAAAELWENTVDKDGTNPGTWTQNGTSRSAVSNSVHLAMESSGRSNVPATSGPNLIFAYLDGSNIRRLSACTWGGSSYTLSATVYQCGAGGTIGGAWAPPLWDETNSVWWFGGKISGGGTMTLYTVPSTLANGTQVDSFSGGPTTGTHPFYLFIDHTDLLHVLQHVDNDQWFYGFKDISGGTTGVMDAEYSLPAQYPAHDTWSTLDQCGITMQPMRDMVAGYSSWDVVHYDTSGRRFANLCGGWGTPSAPVVESHAYATDTAQNWAGTLTVSKPSGTVEGDLLIAWVTVMDYPSIGLPSAPAGWTQFGPDGVGTFNSGYYWRCRQFYKIAGASEGSSYDFTWSGSFAAVGRGSGVIFRVSNHAGEQIDAGVGTEDFPFFLAAWKPVVPATIQVTNHNLNMATFNRGVTYLQGIFTQYASANTWTNDSDLTALVNDNANLICKRTADYPWSMGLDSFVVSSSVQREATYFQIMLRYPVASSGGALFTGWGWIPIGG